MTFVQGLVGCTAGDNVTEKIVCIVFWGEKREDLSRSVNFRRKINRIWRSNGSVRATLYGQSLY